MAEMDLVYVVFDGGLGLNTGAFVADLAAVLCYGCDE